MPYEIHLGLFFKCHKCHNTFYIMFFFFPHFHLMQSGPTEEVEHADILELNTIIDTLRKEKEEMEKEKVCIC